MLPLIWTNPFNPEFCSGHSTTNWTTREVLKLGFCAARNLFQGGCSCSAYFYNNWPIYYTLIWRQPLHFRRMITIFQSFKWFISLDNITTNLYQFFIKSEPVCSVSKCFAATHKCCHHARRSDCSFLSFSYQIWRVQGWQWTTGWLRRQWASRSTMPKWSLYSSVYCPSEGATTPCKLVSSAERNLAR